MIDNSSAQITGKEDALRKLHCHGVRRNLLLVSRKSGNEGHEVPYTIP